MPRTLAYSIAALVTAFVVLGSLAELVTPPLTNPHSLYETAQIFELA